MSNNQINQVGCSLFDGFTSIYTGRMQKKRHKKTPLYGFKTQKLTVLSCYKLQYKINCNRNNDLNNSFSHSI